MFSVRKASLLLTLLGTLALLPISATHAATFTNPSFETGNLTGWAPIGTVSAQTSSIGTGAPAGTFQALLATAGIAVPANNLELFFGLGNGALSALGNGTVINGSGLRQTFTAVAGETLSFQWNFLSDDVGAGSNNDFAFFSLGGLSTLANTSTATFFSSNTVLDSETGFRTFSFVIPTTGSFTLGFGVVNVVDSSVTSALLVDNIQFAPPSAIPEPTTVFGLLGLGSMLVGSLGKRSRS